jgi:hypothetical protein
MSDGLQLNYWKHSWPLRPDVCPCDLDFCDFIYEKRIRDNVIFHFGTGEHHIVGRRNLTLQPPNHIIAVTASQPEYAAYIDFIIQSPHAANYYKVVFADIYTWSARILPQCDVVTLFHLCEFYKEERHSAYAPLDDRRLLDLFISRLQPHGRVLFYRGSAAAEKMLHIVKDFVTDGKLIFEDEYKTLLVYRVGI